MSRYPWLALAALVAGACGGSDDMLGLREGRVQFVLSAPVASAAAPSMVAARPESGAEDGTLTDPAHGDGLFLGDIVSANVTFASILARNLDGVLVDVEMDPPLPVTVDVLRLEGGGREVQLPEGNLPTGSYDQLVVVLTAVSLERADGTTITIDPAGGGWTAIVQVCPFDVGGTTTTVALKFSVRKSFLWRESRFHFQPHLECGTDDAGDA